MEKKLGIRSSCFYILYSQPIPTNDDTHFTAPAKYYCDDMTNDAGRAVFYDHRSNTLSGGDLPGLIVTWPDDKMTHVLLIANPKND